MIALLDPSLPAENETDSDNLGDVIIADANKRILAELFPAHEIVSFPTKRTLSGKELNTIRSCTQVFLGGTNILNGDLKAYNQWKMDASFVGIAYPKFDGVIGMGVGWRVYQEQTTVRTKLFYNRILDRKVYHAVRDQYTYKRVTESGIRNAINTSCPTAWCLNGRRTRRRLPTSGDIVFTLTDYRQSEGQDNNLVRVLLEHSTGKLMFFPQGSKDVEYIESLKEFQNNRERIIVMHRNISEFNNFARDPHVVYVGTRLHGGIRFLQLGGDALIVCVDNRAMEIHKDIRLPAVARDDLDGIREWLRGKLDFGEIAVPLPQINQWKSQFTS
ncbi:MAG: polysaccharide pyruvyl transferase family protein [Methylocella sp.]